MAYGESVIVVGSEEILEQLLVTLFQVAATNESAGVMKSSGQLTVRLASSAVRQRCKSNIYDDW